MGIDTQIGRTEVQDRVRLAVFDFDGTCIKGNSPVLLVQHLMRKGLLSFWEGFDIGLWGLRYKFRLPCDEGAVRGKVFKAFDGRPADRVDAFLREFYDTVVAPRWFLDAEAAMIAHAEEGCFVMVVSATWQAIADRAQESHPFSYSVATNMIVDANGNYTREVDGLPMEGQEKLRAVEEFANERFGEGGWELAYSYGNHHSDAILLDAATVPFAVNPNRPLERIARRRGWPVLEWEL